MEKYKEVAIYHTTRPFRGNCIHCQKDAGYECEPCYKYVCSKCQQNHTDWHWQGKPDDFKFDLGE